uniref:Uncharacterized protein n=1 Tax=Nonomuraea gerenzanensis TaxID=93944 RepID=A0A1M4EKR0_9ACTN|nr:hypothetical protein BN4615_P8947 [Nonomuraea gerenzanensis]
MLARTTGSDRDGACSAAGAGPASWHPVANAARITTVEALVSVMGRGV